MFKSCDGVPRTNSLRTDTTSEVNDMTLMKCHHGGTLRTVQSSSIVLHIRKLRSTFHVVYRGHTRSCGWQRSTPELALDQLPHILIVSKEKLMHIKMFRDLSKD